MELCFCKHQSLIHIWVLLLKHMSHIVYPLSTTRIHEVKHKWDCYRDAVHLRIVCFPQV